MDREYLVIVSKSMNSSEIRYLNKNEPSNTLTMLYPREKEIEYYIEHRNGLFYIITNKNAINFKLVTVSSTDPKVENWKELVPHNHKIHLYSVDIFKYHLAIYKRIDGLKNISIYNFSDESTHDISFDEDLY
ncbi:hypothetical protein LCGC14_3086500, partial [marine sediment metagenome]